MQTIRDPAVAGTFYPGQPDQLTNNVNELLGAVEAGELVTRPKALVVPHAGYIYSGPTAAMAYASLAENAAEISRVVLLGPVHRVPVRGLALPGVDAFATPLGTIELDSEAISNIIAMPQIVVSPNAHRLEHSLEVQLPFLQTVLDDFKLVPLAVGDVSPQQVAEVLEKLWGGPETLIVISSDLSHFHSYQYAQKLDRETVESILDLRALTSYEQACGATPVNGLLLAARRHGLKPQLLDMCNSGDTAGDRQRVVGYAALAFCEPDTFLIEGLEG
ncbi:MAG TPA: AmmeMemoRadiSam system protein B [Spongiibacteraceae bacterium]|nr:AmmeMemoRadiSam system protein B [Spongiibacteraceae bacterium]